MPEHDISRSIADGTCCSQVLASSLTAIRRWNLCADKKAQSPHASGVLRIKAIAFSAYPVSDMPRSRAFYEGLLGLSLSYNFHDSWVEYEVAGATFAITTTAKDLRPGARGGFVAFEVNNLDKWIILLQAKGVPMLVEPFETRVCRMVVVADPDGNGITLHQAKPGHS